MDLRLLASPQEFEFAAAWLRRERISKWLDMHTLVGPPSPRLLQAMAQRASHVIRLFAPSTDAPPIGIVAISNVHPIFGTGMLWYALGEPAYEGRGFTTAAVSTFLRYVFDQLGMTAINAWTVQSNDASMRVLEKNDFRYIGRQRKCHYVDSKQRDRLLYDLLACERVAR